MYNVWCSFRYRDGIVAGSSFRIEGNTESALINFLLSKYPGPITILKIEWR